MNNSLQVDLSPEFLEETADNMERLREREAKIVRVIEALGGLMKSKEWSTLKDELFDEALETLEKKQQHETQKPEIDLPTLYRLQGQIIWAKRWDLESLIDKYQIELANIRKQLNPSAPGV